MNLEGVVVGQDGCGREEGGAVPVQGVRDVQMRVNQSGAKAEGKSRLKCS
jgi:hypothetical protein